MGRRTVFGICLKEGCTNMICSLAVRAEVQPSNSCPVQMKRRQIKNESTPRCRLLNFFPVGTIRNDCSHDDSSRVSLRLVGASHWCVTFS
jgi:hypothetical protein